MHYPSFEQFAEVIRSYTGLKHNRHIGPETQFQRDLAMTTVECANMLKNIEGHYGIAFSPASFDLKDNESLFYPDRLEAPPVIQTVFGGSRTVVRPLTAGNLCRAALRELSSLQQVPPGRQPSRI